MVNLLSLEELYTRMFLIRSFEEEVLKLFGQGKLFGTTHTYIGQEANAVGIISNLKNTDIVVSNHRCHGHYIAHKNNPYALLCEMMGKRDGLCGGRGGSQHICDDGFFSNGVQGGIMPLAAGLSFSEKFNATNKVVVVFIGDGTLGEGVLYETLNIVSKWNLPLFIVVENNRYSQSTKIDLTLAGSISDRFKAFNIKTTLIETFDVLEIRNTSQKMIEWTRKNLTPACLIINTYRFSSHSKSDDGREKKEIERWKKKDPLLIAEKKLTRSKIENVQANVKKCISEQISMALKAPIAE